ncbi:hypothetical protein [Phenylobacterium soli]|uniref:Uncharacterized protein n=1 Tax=Phenylobacterium soli TaxID=2170551 RepID=A0A328AIQ8_9CAUL|nr:hypothetical protein [Phenylobacterium soli]RAK53294.1 hypothetical protein DJ017_01495 [Phenylobacterium soli]
MGTKTFHGQSLEDVDDKADAWLAEHPQLKNVQMHALGVREAANGNTPPPREAGRWSIVLSYED